MPVIKIFSRVPVDAAVAHALVTELEGFCLGPLRAASDAIQIAFVSVMPAGRGAPVLVEAHFRAQPYRDAAALHAFMDGVERSFDTHLQVRPRIRCFAVDQASLFARH